MTHTQSLGLDEQAALQRIRDGKCERFTYQGFHQPAHCFIAIEGGDSSCPVVILSEAEDNNGTSITNTYETIATEVKRQILTWADPLKIRWLERYPQNKGLLEHESLARVTLQWDHRAKKFHSPQWAHVALQLDAA